MVRIQIFTRCFTKSKTLASKVPSQSALLLTCAPSSMRSSEAAQAVHRCKRGKSNRTNQAEHPHRAIHVQMRCWAEFRLPRLCRKRYRVRCSRSPQYHMDLVGAHAACLRFEIETERAYFVAVHRSAQSITQQCRGHAPLSPVAKAQASHCMWHLCCAHVHVV